MSPALARSHLARRAAEGERRRSVEMRRIAEAEQAASIVRGSADRRRGWWTGLAWGKEVALRRSGLLLTRWYAAEHGLRSPREAFRDFVNRGVACDISPNPFFDARWYRAAHLASSSGEAPIRHYLRIGAINALQPGPLFDPVLYAALNPDLVREPDLLSHFLRKGVFEGRRFLPDPAAS